MYEKTFVTSPDFAHRVVDAEKLLSSKWCLILILNQENFSLKILNLCNKFSYWLLISPKKYENIFGDVFGKRLSGYSQNVA
jgi:hypothetical protein